MATQLALLPCGLQFAIAPGMNLDLTPGQHVLRRDEADGAVQSHRVVVIHVTLNEPPCVIHT